ncbi:uncharacterized protein LOC113553462 [Rhopalosiphum maidis]|uniref:uncharacterized protein LOC113552139 n=1 Tax=Rhopalosiphum maidis TaxID=43146 RepID=UPI000EFEF155|nr:uncharacterized protein LOC113552139 [Rhopalosiphum maidis]XP_026812597.1 uncharacterized protein LOC113553462 [Rhopalosiphum maidis]
MTAKVDGTIGDMTAAEAFGPGSRIASFKLEGLHTEQNQFASCVMYGVAAVDDRDGRRHSHRLVFKYKHSTPAMQEFYNNDNQFHNEVLFYERIAPFLLSHSSRRNGDESATTVFCRYFYGRNICGDQAPRDVIVLENATANGYQEAMVGHRLSLDFEHLTVALRTLAKFHGLSYRSKRNDLKKFKEIISEVKETQWSESGEWIFHPSVLQNLYSVALDWLKQRHTESDDSNCDDNVLKWIRKFESELLADPLQILRRVTSPLEPLAVLCHGDFNRNNLLFRYDDSGRPVDVLPFDMATIRYGSLAIDLSFFLYLNTDRQTRDDHWDELLDVYCAALAEEAGDVPVPNRNQIDAEMHENGFVGLSHVTYFARVMLEENKFPDKNEFPDADDSQLSDLLLSQGGDLATEWVADVIHHFLRRKYARTPTVNATAYKISTSIEI